MANEDEDRIDPASFANVLHEVFYGEEWREIEPFAARVSMKLFACTSDEWEQIRPAVKRAWERNKWH